jgi:hypothetical protein
VSPAWPHFTLLCVLSSEVKFDPLHPTVRVSRVWGAYRSPSSHRVSQVPLGTADTPGAAAAQASNSFCCNVNVMRQAPMDRSTCRCMHASTLHIQCVNAKTAPSTHASPLCICTTLLSPSPWSDGWADPMARARSSSLERPVDLTWLLRSNGRLNVRWLGGVQLVTKRRWGVVCGGERCAGGGGCIESSEVRDRQKNRCVVDLGRLRQLRLGLDGHKRVQRADATLGR